MFQLAMPVGPEQPEAVPVTNPFFLPAAIVQPNVGAVLEEVLLFRDELANAAWAVERRLGVLWSGAQRGPRRPPPRRGRGRSSREVPRTG